jgi:uncharacterized membrane protein YgcG
MKTKTIKKTIIGFTAVIFIFMTLFCYRNFFKPQLKKEASQKITIKDGNNEINVNDQGIVELKNPDKVLYQNWPEETIKALFENIRQKSKNSNLNLSRGEYPITYFDGERSYTFLIDSDDSELSEVLDKLKNLNSGRDLSEYFNSPLPSGVSNNGNSGGGSNDGGNNGGGNGNSGGGSGGSGQWDCPFWRLSYCVWPVSPPPIGAPVSPSPSASTPTQPSPSPSVVQRIPDCDMMGATITGKTVISNTLCVKE